MKNFNPILFYLICSLLDISITSWGLMHGYAEGNPLLAWIQSPFLMVSFMFLSTLAAMFFVDLLPIKEKYKDAGIIAGGAWRVTFGFIPWLWLFGIPQVIPPADTLIFEFLFSII